MQPSSLTLGRRWNLRDGEDGEVGEEGGLDMAEEEVDEREEDMVSLDGRRCDEVELLELLERESEVGEPGPGQRQTVLYTSGQGYEISASWRLREERRRRRTV